MVELIFEPGIGKVRQYLGAAAGGSSKLREMFVTV